MKKIFLAILLVCVAGVRADIVVNPVPGHGGGGATTLNDLTDVNDSGKATNYALLYNGTMWVAAPQGTSFTFSIASFSDGISSTIEIGTGVWKSSGSITFSASYSNGPPSGSTVTFSGWSNLPLSTPFTSTHSIQIVSYPSVAGSVVFGLSAQTSATSASTSITHTFVNRRFWGVSTTASGYTEANVEALANTELSNSKANTFSVTAGAGEYIIYSYPSRLGTATFTVGGFEGGFNTPETVSITNGFGFTENFYVYRSINSNLGSTTVVAS